MFRIATWNLENFDADKTGSDGKIKKPTFEERVKVIAPALERLRADLICFQEVNGQEHEGRPRDLSALRTLLGRTKRYADYGLVTTQLQGKDDVYDQRNLVIAYRPDFALEAKREIKHDTDVLPHKPVYKVATDPEGEAKELSWERPLLYARFRTPGDETLHVLNAHFKSKRPSDIPSQKVNRYTWRSAGGWAEGFFMSSLKRVGAALEARVFLDQIFASAEAAGADDPKIVLCGDLNATSDEVPVMALRGRVEETGNPALAGTEMFPCENTIPESARYTLFHHGRGEMIDHLLVSRGLLNSYIGAEIHNEVLTDESIAFRSDAAFPAPDHAPVIASFAYDPTKPVS